MADWHVPPFDAAHLDNARKKLNAILEEIEAAIAVAATLPTAGSAGPTVTGVTASELLAAGAFVNLYTSAGALRMRNADADDVNKPAHGFVLAGVAAAAAGDVYGPGNVNTALAGLTPGTIYWLSTTAGGVVNAAPSTSLNGQQELGVATAATKLLFSPSPMNEAP